METDAQRNQRLKIEEMKKKIQEKMGAARFASQNTEAQPEQNEIKQEQNSDGNEGESTQAKV